MPKRARNLTETGRRIGLLRRFLSLPSTLVGNLLGVTHRTILYWESGDRMPLPDEYAYLKARLMATGHSNITVLRRFEAEVLGITPDFDVLPKLPPRARHQLSHLVTDLQRDARPTATQHRGSYGTEYHEVGPARRRRSPSRG